MFGAISVSIYYTASEGVLTVSDTGVGIPSGDITKVTDRFHRVAVSIAAIRCEAMLDWLIGLIVYLA